MYTKCIHDDDDDHLRNMLRNAGDDDSMRNMLQKIENVYFDWENN